MTPFRLPNKEAPTLQLTDLKTAWKGVWVFGDSMGVRACKHCVNCSKQMRKQAQTYGKQAVAVTMSAPARDWRLRSVSSLFAFD